MPMLQILTRAPPTDQKIRYAAIMYSDQDAILISKSMKSARQASINVRKRYKFRKKNSLFLPLMTQQYARARQDASH